MSNATHDTTHDATHDTQSEVIFTFDELWLKACESAGRLIPRTTFRDWITKVCVFTLKQEYTEADWAWVEEWISFQRRYPKRSTVKVKRFHEHIQRSQKSA